MLGFPDGSAVKNPSASAEDAGSIPGLGGFPGGGNGNPLRYSCLGNLMDREAWWVIVHGVARLGYDLATKPLSHYIQHLVITYNGKESERE